MGMHVQHYQTINALLARFVQYVLQVVEGRCQTGCQGMNTMLK